MKDQQRKTYGPGRGRHSFGVLPLLMRVEALSGNLRDAYLFLTRVPWHGAPQLSVKLGSLPLAQALSSPATPANGLGDGHVSSPSPSELRAALAPEWFTGATWWQV